MMTDLAGPQPGGETCRASLVIVAFHRPEGLRELLSRTNDPRIEQIVVNIEADAEIADIAAEHQARCVEIRNNLGYAAGVNRGATAASCPVVVFGNDDISAKASAILALADLVASGRCDVAVPRIEDDLGRFEPTIRGRLGLLSLLLEQVLLPDRPPRMFAHHTIVAKWREPPTPTTIEAASAVIAAVGRELLIAQPLPECYFMYWEEIEWFERLRRRGATVEFRPEITVTHHGGRAVTSAFKQELLSRNAVRCIRRNRGPVAAFTAYLLTVAWQARLVLVAHLLSDRRGAPSRSQLLATRRAGLRAALRSWSEIR